MLDGRVGARRRSRTTKTVGTRFELYVEVNLIDPLNKVKDVELLYVVGDVTKQASPAVPGRGREPLTRSSKVGLTVTGSKATGLMTVAVPKIRPKGS